MLRRFAAAGFILGGCLASAQVIPSVESRALSAPPTVDGEINEREWEGVPPITAVFFDDETGKPLGDPVTFRIASVGGTIYFAVKVIDDPKTLQDSEYRANVGLESNDHIQLSVEPFSKGSSFNGFRVNPSGANQIIIAGGRAPKTEWQGSLRSAAKITSTGWQAEMGIPWALMDLPSAGIRDVMINVTWNERSSLRRRIWHFNNGKGADTPLWKGVEIPRVSGRPVLQLLPYFYAGLREKADDPILNAGLDFKTSLTSKSQLVGTLNPDFRNIENQILSLDFSYFERLAGESRPFFQEGSGYRDEADRIFASQRIRNFDAGFNTYGSLDNRSTYSLLATADFGRQDVLVGSYNRRLSTTSNLGAALVQNSARGSRNTAATASFGQRLGDWSVFSAAAYTDDQQQGEGSTFSAGFSHGSRGFFAFSEYYEVSPNFFPRLGFAPERDFRAMTFWSGWEKPHPRGPIMETEIEGGGGYAERLNGEVYRRNAAVNASLTFRNLVDLDFGANQEFFQGNVDQSYYVSLEHPRGNNYRRWSVWASSGVVAGQKIDSAGLSLSYRPFKRVQLGLSSQWQDHFEKSRQIIFSLNWERGLYESLGGRLVERDGKINWHLSWRKSGGLGAEYFLIFGDPNAQQFRKQIILKAVYPLSVRF